MNDIMLYNFGIFIYVVFNPHEITHENVMRNKSTHTHTNLIVKSTRILTLNENDFGYSANAKFGKMVWCFEAPLCCVIEKMKSFIKIHRFPFLTPFALISKIVCCGNCGSGVF